MQAIQNEYGSSKIKKAFAKLNHNFSTSLKQGTVYKWSLWWSLGMCGNYQVMSAMQSKASHINLTKDV